MISGGEAYAFHPTPKTLAVKLIRKSLPYLLLWEAEKFKAVAVQVPMVVALTFIDT